MFKCGFRLVKGLYKARLICDVTSKKSANILQSLTRGNSCLAQINNTDSTLFFLPKPLFQNQHSQEKKWPEHSTICHSLDIYCKKFLTTNYENNVRDDYFQESLLETNNTYFMGSLLKKRRRKMNRQKYKKRRKRDRFKREALKNLREKKRQRKERAAERKTTILSNMVVNKSISKRRARYLSHKLLPGVIKGQGLG